MKARVTWLEERTFIGQNETGHSVVLGRAGSEGGPAPGASPMELVLIGTGGCAAYDVVLILEKGRQQVTGCDVALEADRAETDPRVFTRIHMHFKVKGRGLDAAKVKRAIELSADKYCSASAMLAKTATITHDFEVIDG